MYVPPRRCDIEFRIKDIFSKLVKGKENQENLIE